MFAVLQLDPNAKTESEISFDQSPNMARMSHLKQNLKGVKPSELKLSSQSLEPPTGVNTERPLPVNFSSERKEPVVLNPAVIQASDANTPTSNRNELALVPRPLNSQPFVSSSPS